jgi:hypothetical protein
MLITPVFILAQETDNSSAAANAANPLAFVTKLQFQPNYTWMDNGGDQLSLISRIMKPTATIGLPFIKSKEPDKIYTIYRLEVPIVSQTFGDFSPANATGLSDLIFLDAVAFKQKWGLLGAGFGMILPTASPDILGSGKLSMGPVFVALYTKIPKLQLGALAQQYFSVAGSSSRADQNFMYFQPIVNKILSKGYFLQFSPIMKFDWENDEYNIPLSIGVGRAFAKNLSVNIAPEYVISGPGKGNFTIRLNVNTMFAPVN